MHDHHTSGAGLGDEPITDVLLQLERYFDTVPRQHATVEEVGPFTLFVGEPGGWTFCARPRLTAPGATRAAAATYDATSVREVLQRMAALDLPQVIEWVDDVTPDLLEAVSEAGGLEVEEIPLMVLTGRPVPPALHDDLRVRILGPSDVDALAQARAVTGLAFDSSGSEVGAVGVVERDAAIEPVPDQLLDVLRDGRVGWAVVEHRDCGVIASGRHLPVGEVSEIVGVATLPAFRRRGLAAHVTTALIEHATSGGVSTVFLTASSEPVARLYARLGFERIATAYAAERG